MNTNFFLQARIMFIVMAGMAAVVPQAQAASYSGGNGTESEPYQIATTVDWETLTATPEDWDAYFILTADLDFGGADIPMVAPDTNSLQEDFQGTAFTGIFDGNGNVIRHGQINLPSNDYVGLVGCLGEGGTIRNLGVEAVALTGNDYVGGLVGLNNGSVNACYAIGTVQGDSALGGLLGINYGMVLSSYSKVTVTSIEDGGAIGGLVGNNSLGTIESCYATGAVTGNSYIGGLVGNNVYGTITACYATGVVTGGENNIEVGGLVGVNDYLLPACFWEVTSSGQSISAGGRGLTADQMRTVAIFQNAGWSAFSAWVMTEGELPRLEWEGLGWPSLPEPEPVPFAGSGTAEDPFRIVTAEEFILLGWHIGVLDKHIVLTDDIDLTGTSLYPIGWDIGSFNGTFDGNGHVVRQGQINLPSSSYVGLFGLLGSDAIICNLGVEALSVTGNYHVGGLLGENEGTVQFCYGTGTVKGNHGVGGLVGMNNGGTVKSCYFSGSIMGGGDFIGGLLGYNAEGMLESCCTTGMVTGIYCVGGIIGKNQHGIMDSCYATNDAIGSSTIGGLVGYNWGGTITSCYATGVVTGDRYLGGMVGSNSTGTFSSCYWDTDTSGQTSSEGGEGRTTAEMTYPYAPNTYVEWDFEAVWAEDPDYSANNGYPYLQDYVLPVTHPADTNGDFRMVLAEAIAYLTGWQQGGNPMAHAIRAAYLWQNGEVYSYDSEAEPPLCWVLAEKDEG